MGAFIDSRIASLEEETRAEGRSEGEGKDPRLSEFEKRDIVPMCQGLLILMSSFEMAPDGCRSD
jgi:hypothetical protein